MPRSTMHEDEDNEVPNYSKYDYSDTLQQFQEFDRLHENELSMLECYGDFQLEALLNSFNDR